MLKNELNDLAIKWNTDKVLGHHGYTKYYDEWFSHLTNSNICLLEIGVGGDTYSGSTGASVKMWQEYFPYGEIHGLDIDPICKSVQTERIKIHIGDQSDPEVLNKIFTSTKNGFDIIIDDGSHKTKDIIKSFHELFPKLNKNGYYIIEDTHCSYEEKFDNERSEFDDFIKFLVSKIDCSGRKLTTERAQDYSLLDQSQLDIFESQIETVHVYRGLVLIRKRKNDDC